MRPLGGKELSPSLPKGTPRFLRLNCAGNTASISGDGTHAMAESSNIPSYMEGDETDHYSVAYNDRSNWSQHLDIFNLLFPDPDYAVVLHSITGQREQPFDVPEHDSFTNIDYLDPFEAFDVFPRDNEPSSVEPVTDMHRYEVNAPVGIDIIERGSDNQDQADFVMELFQQRVEELNESEENFPYTYLESDHFGSNNLALDLGMRLFPGNHEHDLAITDNHTQADNQESAFDSISANHRSSEEQLGSLMSGEISSDGEGDENGILTMEMDEDDDVQHVMNAGDDESSFQFCWDSLHLEDPPETSDDYGWEELDAGADEGEALNMFLNIDFDADDNISISTEFQTQDDENARNLSSLRGFEWEVVVDVDQENLGSIGVLEGETRSEDHNENGNIAEYEMLFAPLAETENPLLGNPPTSKSFIENLPSVVLNEVDAANGVILCAICKDEIIIGAYANLLPCSHKYHGNCIIPWLNIRNTCPICRHELPVDNPVATAG